MKLDSSDKKVHCNTENPKTCAYILTKIDKTSEKIKVESKSQKMYAFISHIYTNVDSPIINHRDSLQLTNWILYSGATCHRIPEISEFIPHNWWKQIDILKLQIGIFSHKYRQEKLK